MDNRKTAPCSPRAPNLLHVLPSRMVGWHNLCSPDGGHGGHVGHGGRSERGGHSVQDKTGQDRTKLTFKLDL